MQGQTPGRPCTEATLVFIHEVHSSIPNCILLIVLFDIVHVVRTHAGQTVPRSSTFERSITSLIMVHLLDPGMAGKSDIILNCFFLFYYSTDGTRSVTLKPNAHRHFNA